MWWGCPTARRGSEEGQPPPPEGGGLRRPILMSCVHHFDLDQTNKGICRHCGEERQFPWGGKGGVVVLKKGNPSSGRVGRIASKFAPEEKAAILEETDRLGVLAVAKARGIPDSTLYSWRTRRHRARLRTQIAVSESAAEAQHMPHDLWLRRDGAVIQIYVSGKLWAAFGIQDRLQAEITRSVIMAIVERYLEKGDLVGGTDGAL